MRFLSAALRRFVLFLNGLPFGTALGTFFYRTATRLAILYLRQEETIAFYVRGSMGRGTFVPAMSDVDLNIVIEPMAEEREYEFLQTYYIRRRRLARLIPSLHCYLHTVDGLKIAVAAGWPYVLNPREEWVRFAGRDVFPYKGHSPQQLALGAAKLVYRRIFGGERRDFNRKASAGAGAFIKINVNVLREAARLLSNRTVTGLETLQQMSIDQKKRNYYSNQVPELNEKRLLAWHEVLTAVGSEIKPQLLMDRSAGNYAMSGTSIPPRTKSEVVKEFDLLAAALRPLLPPGLCALVLNAIPVTHYNFKLYLIVRDDADRMARTAIFHAVKRIYTEHRTKAWSYFTTFFTPLVIAESAFRNAAVCEGSGLEPMYWERHGHTFFNDLGHDASGMDKSFSGPSFLADCMAHLRFVRNRRDLYPYASSRKFKTAFVDYVTGTLPSTRLFLEKRIVATTPGEAVEEYARHYGDSYTAFLQLFYEKCAGRSPESLDEPSLMEEYRRHFSLLRAQAEQIDALYKKVLHVV